MGFKMDKDSRPFLSVLRGGGFACFVGLEYAARFGKDSSRYFFPVLGGPVVAGRLIRIDTGAKDDNHELDAFWGPARERGARFALKRFFLFSTREEQKCLRFETLLTSD